MGKARIRLSDLQGCGRLAVDAALGMTNLVESMHRAVARTADPFDFSGPVVRLVYRSVRAATTLAGRGADLLIPRLAPLLPDGGSSVGREAALAVLNGVVGDHLSDTGNPLAIEMQFRQDGQALELTAPALARSIARPGARLMLFVHGLCSNHLQWTREEDHWAGLASSLGHTPIHLHYNTGLHVSTNGRRLAELLETLLAHWPAPVEQLAVVAHSMGGLVARSACHHATIGGHGWRRRLRKLVFLGTPHHGTSLEQAGNWVDSMLGACAYSAPLASVGKIRSAGITDLRFGSTRDEDWQERDRFERSGDRRLPMPLPEGVDCYAIAGAPGGIGDRVLGDGLVPLASALGEHDDPRFDLAFPESHRWIARGAGHLGLLRDPGVYDRLRDWLAAA